MNNFCISVVFPAFKSIDSSPTTVIILGHGQTNKYINSSENNSVSGEYEARWAPFD